MKRKIIIDLGCKAGGASKGYANAGFDVIGVDTEAQPNYPYRFIQRDALYFLRVMLAGGTVDWVGPGIISAYHASMPCQLFSHGTVAQDSSKYVDLVTPIRPLLQATGLPYIMENVKRAPLIDPITICGASFGLEAKDEEGPLVLRRHRLFESNVGFIVPPCACREYQRNGYKIAGCYGGARRTRYEAEHIRHGGYVPPRPILDDLMGINWMTEAELFQAVPPSYTWALGLQLLQHLGQPLSSPVKEGL